MKCFNSASQQELILPLGIFGNVCRRLGFHIGGGDALQNESSGPNVSNAEAGKACSTARR